MSFFYEQVSFLKTQERFSAIKVAVITSGCSPTEIEEFKALEVTEIFVKPSGLVEYKDLWEK